jgi:hypothetical protein
MSNPTVNHHDVYRHLDLLFGREATGFVNLRGIGEKGTAREGVFREDIFLEPAALGWERFVASVVFHATRWGQHDVATFIIPCTLKEDRGTAENCDVFRTICADFDTGDTDAKLAYADEHFGEPSMVVLSGGTTDEGKAKRHAYWFIAPTSDVASVVKARDAIARKVGADIQFGLGVDGNPYGRAHQPIRLAGSVHGKNGVRRPVVIERVGVDIVRQPNMTWFEKAESMPPSPWALVEKPADPLTTPEGPAAVDLLTEDVKAGAEGAITRWSAFNGVAGHYIHTARVGKMTLDAARLATFGWMQAHMNPPWPEARFNTEWLGLLRNDLSTHGPMPEPEKPILEEGKGLAVWAANRWAKGETPTRQFLIDKLVLASKHTLFVAEGGAGKTFLMLDLGLKIASRREGDTWCGLPVLRRGAAVVLTTEDDKEELHIRLDAIDPDRSRREEAGDDFIVFPTINSGGAFALVEKDPRTQESRPSRKWLEFFALLRQIPNLQLVVIDTLNSVLHGEENSATITNEFIRVASQVCGELGAALVVLHHIRKQGDEPIRNAEQMLSAVRGSSAMPSAFRATIGIWHASDYDRRMKAMDLVPKKKHLWKMGVCKANNPEMFDGERTLLRTQSGMLVDVTARDKFNEVNFLERHAWLLAAVTLAARAGHPYSIEGKNAKSGLYRRRSELPETLRSVGPGEFSHMVDELMLTKKLVAAAAKGGRDKKWLDLPNGPIATDDAGAELASGAYDPPEWSTYRYDHDLHQVIKA